MGLIALLLAGMALAAPSNALEDDEFGQALVLLGRGKAAPALKKFAKLNDEAGGECVSCLVGMARAYNSLRRYQDAQSAGEKALGLTNDREALATAETVVGVSHFMRAPLKTPRAGFLQHVQRSLPHFRRAYELDNGASEATRWNLASALEWLGEHEEAGRLFSDPESFEEDETVDDEPLEMAQAVPPRRIFSVNIEYRPRAKRLRVVGTVELRSVIDEKGRVTKVRVLEGLEGCTSQAILAVRRRRYEPARLDGKPVSVFYRSTVNFNLR